MKQTSDKIIGKGNQTVRKFIVVLAISLIGNPDAFGQKLEKEALCKKWNLDKYSYWFFAEDPEKIEMDDYILFKSNLTFESISEGKYETGNWQLDAARNRILMTDDKGELPFIIDKLDDNELILIIDDPSDPDAKNLKIHFKS